MATNPNYMQPIENLFRPYVIPNLIKNDLEEGYATMAMDEVREAEALTWSENLISDLNFKKNETW